MSINKRSNDVMLLSTYLDGELTAREKEKLERRLRANPQLKKELENLRATRAMIRSLPRKKVPRNFVLTPEMVAQRKTTSWLPALGLTSAASAILALVLLFFQFGPGLIFNGVMTASEPQQEVAMYAEDAFEESEEEAGDPEIIYWGGPPSPQVVEGKGGGQDAGPVQSGPSMLAEEMPPLEAAREPVAGEQPQEESAEAQPAPEMEAVPEMQSAPEEESLEAAPAEAMDQDFDPILGIRPTGEADPMLVSPHNTPAPEPVTRENITIAVILVLVGFSLAAGLTALILWRRMR